MNNFVLPKIAVKRVFIVSATLCGALSYSLIVWGQISSQEFIDQQDQPQLQTPVDLTNAAYCKIQNLGDCDRGDFVEVASQSIKSSPAHVWGKSVGRILFAFENEQGYTVRPCTATLLDRQHLVTAYHCGIKSLDLGLAIADGASGQDLQGGDDRSRGIAPVAAKLRMGYLSPQPVSSAGESFDVDPHRIEELSDRSLDVAVYTLKEPISERLSKEYPPAKFLQLKPGYGSRLTYIGYPAGYTLHWVDGCIWKELPVAAELDQFLYHSCSNQGGFSGAPIFYDNKVVGFHLGTFGMRPELKDYGIRTRGVSIASILEAHQEWREFYGIASQAPVEAIASKPIKLTAEPSPSFRLETLSQILNHYQPRQDIEDAMSVYGNAAEVALGPSNVVYLRLPTKIQNVDFTIQQLYRDADLIQVEIASVFQAQKPDATALVEAKCNSTFNKLLRLFAQNYYNAEKWSPSTPGDSSNCPTQIVTKRWTVFTPKPLESIDEPLKLSGLYPVARPDVDNDQADNLKVSYYACNDRLSYYLNIDRSSLRTKRPYCKVSITDFAPFSSAPNP